MAKRPDRVGNRTGRGRRSINGGHFDSRYARDEVEALELILENNKKVRRDKYRKRAPVRSVKMPTFSWDN